jgi:two-component system CAI-1 autoinducer sensor kinase/phosphatase CqsS
MVASPSYNTLGIRLSTAAAGSILLFYRKLPRGLKENFHFVWISLITFVLPFSFGLMMLLNAAYTPSYEQVSSVWVYQYLVALFFFVNLAHHGPLCTLLWIFASALAFTPLIFIGAPNWLAIERTILLPLPVYITAVVVGSLMNRNVAMVQTEKLRAASAIGANLAHELRTPLASIGAMSKGVANLLPMLTDAYDKAKSSGIELPPLRKSQLSQLNTTLASIGNEVEYSNTIIDMLLVNTADKPLSDVDSDQFLVKEAIQEAVDRYPFNNQKERELISIEVDTDFELVAPRLLVIHVLFNLIKNALYFVQKGGKGAIEIKADVVDGRGVIVVHDTGIGIPAAIKPHIFERFYTTIHTGQGAGIGLSFCFLVMDSIGGAISCDSQEGEYTTFTMSFPEIRG